MQPRNNKATNQVWQKHCTQIQQQQK